MMMFNDGLYSLLGKHRGWILIIINVVLCCLLESNTAHTLRRGCSEKEIFCILTYYKYDIIYRVYLL